MPLVVTDEGERYLMDCAIRKVSGFESLRLFLYVNDVSPALDSTRDDFTGAGSGGLGATTLARANWSAPATVGGRASMSYGSAPILYTATTDISETVYGYFVTDLAEEVCIWAERFPVPTAIDVGTIVSIWPTITGRSEFSPA